MRRAVFGSAHVERSLAALTPLWLRLRAAADNKVSRREIKEVLRQAVIYCGVPAANSAFHMTADVFAAMDAQGPSAS
ncbi:carboxymuconolactone decarboxylase family protein [Cupriavidus sp. 30B13]|uniref:carboxymuconolactone decarboxylase family protein n=1 Tax=Cupriavidus sp. 30B13 TaxID=3384241 RepID=UPI003B91412A